MTDTQPVNPETEAQGTPAAEVLETPTDPKSTKKESAKPSRKKAGDAEKLAALEEKLAEAEQKQGELQNSLMRTAAEYDNYRKRSQKEQESAFGNGVSHAANALLPVLDTLNAAATADTTDPEYKKGVLMTLAKCEEVFKFLGIQEIAAMGQPFDPELHNAVMQQAADGAAPGTITLVMQKGYTLNGRVIRHAMVAVAP
ncbi:MAG: nucleotide exchange factor GrpE [Ruminococcaceae bacterium]|nr:nucleotide exchange factor GrpE [Oscillospiraceae bacterium]